MKKIKTDIKKLENSTVEVNAVISWNELESFRGDALKKIADTLEVDGFRKGNVPESIIVEKFGEIFILGEAANIAIYKHYPDILKENNLKPIGYPEITLTKIAPNNDLEFKMKFSQYPDIELPDYKKISAVVNSKNKKITVDEKDVNEAILKIKKYRFAAQQHEGHKHKEGEECKHEHKNPDEVDEKELPVLDDEFVKTIGGFKTVEEFKENLKTEIKTQKELENREKSRVELSESIIKESNIDIPQILIDSELDKMLAQMKDDISRMGLKYEEYLKNAKKDEEGIKTEWRDEAEKRAKMELILKEIAKAENLGANEDELKKQVETLSKMHKDVDSMNISLYVENIMINEEVMKFLESQK